LFKFHNVILAQKPFSLYTMALLTRLRL